MKKHWIKLVLAYWLFACDAVAQLPSGSIAPDFSVQDIFGQAHHLYDVLNDDKIVLLELGATWCPPCWVYHQSGALQEFYEMHGPAGGDQVRVYWVEGDPNTNVDCIYGQAGCNHQSEGNYVQGIDYPIINSSAIASSYQISYYPTLFLICPNKKVYEIDPINADDLWLKAKDCPVMLGENNAGVFDHDPGYLLPEICNEVKLAPSFLLTNLGTSTLTAADVLVKWNGNTVQQISWTGQLNTYEEALIQFDSFQVNSAGELNTIVSSVNNGANEADFSNNYKNNFFDNAKQFQQTQVLLKIRTDNYGAETYWELHDEFGAVLQSGGNQLVGINGGGAFPLGAPIGPGAYPSNTLIKDTLFLPASGCYSIHFVDAYGDGMCCEYGNGYYKLYNINDPVNSLISAGQFELSDNHAFSAGLSTSVDALSSIEKIMLSLYPNPVNDVLTVQVNFSEFAPKQAYFSNVTGQTVLQLRLDNSQVSDGQTLSLPTHQLSNGLYFLSLETENGQRTLAKKFIVQH